MKIKKGDEVVVITGKDRGQKGRVLASFPTENKVIVEGVNRVTKHTRVSSNARGSQTGGIITQEAKINVSNLMIVDADGNASRVGYRRDDETGRNVRVSRRSGKDIS
jgi:large subunit ribosomal protein L24